jgi:transcriptional regulator with XRE-family HTH domain
MPVATDGMSHHIGRVVREYRTAAGISVKDLAMTCRLDDRTVSQIERGDSMRKDVDLVVSVLADLIGADPRGLWQVALGEWWTHDPPDGYQPPRASLAAELRTEVALRSEALKEKRSLLERAGTRKAAGRAT